MGLPFSFGPLTCIFAKQSTKTEAYRRAESRSTTFGGRITDQRDREERIHSAYEDAVDRRAYDYGFVYDQADDVEPGPLVRSLARDAHRFYFDLVRAYDRYGYNAEVDRITRNHLSDAANAVADLLSALAWS